MILSSTEQDRLNLDLVKQHLVVTNDDDDQLIESYIKASIGYVEAYLHERILDETYEADQNELKLVNSKYVLRLPIEPKIVAVMMGTHAEQIPRDGWEYKSGHLIITPIVHFTPTSFSALVGLDPRWIESVNQARLLLIGQFYNYRESIADLRIMELPNGVKFILDNVTGASI